jgi:tetratricopeptide (TPR) repeat protein
MAMNLQEVQDIVLRNTADIQEVRQRVDNLTSKDLRAETALRDLQRRVVACLGSFHRDRYKTTDQRLVLAALANEILIFDKLGYDLGSPGSQFVLGVAALLEGRSEAALERLGGFVRIAPADDPNIATAYYLSGMICYNRRDLPRAVDCFEAAFRCSTEAARDWQSKIYVAELLYFLRRPREMIEKAFYDVDEQLKTAAGQNSQTRFLRATLYLKLGNCFVGTPLEPRQPNPMVNNPVAVSYYKQARQALPSLVDQDSLLPVVIDYSLAQALLVARSVDMDLATTPSELLADVFQRLRRIVLTKREEIILAQSYFMLATCAFYSTQLSNDIAEIYLEYARHQTLVVPSEVCFYSCITKELLTRDEFVAQIDYYGHEIDRARVRR